MGLPESHAAQAPAGLPPGFTERVLAGLDGAERRRSQREARRLGVATLFIGVAIGLVLLAAVPFHGPGFGTRTIVLWLARALVVLNTLGRQEDALLARLHLDALPVGVTTLTLLSCLVAVWRLTTYNRRPGRRPRRRTFVALFALMAVALALALLTPLRAWQTGALRWGETNISDPSAGAVLVVNGNVTLSAGLNGGVSVIFGSAHVTGTVQGDVVAVLGGVVLNPGSLVQGDVIAVGGRVDNVGQSRMPGRCDR